MKMKLLSAAILAAGLFSATAAVQAAVIEFSGTFDNMTNLFTGEFVVDNALNEGGVAVYTGSWKDYMGEDYNFDPFLVLWDSLGERIDFSNDISVDNYNARIEFAPGALADGVYSFTIGNWPNEPNGNNFSDGFKLDGSGITRLQPDNTGPYWNVFVMGSVTAVPEPETWAMLLMGLGMVGAVARRRRLY